MVRKKDIMPRFKTEEEESEYWDSHSPLDIVAEPKTQKVKVRGIKDRPITIRLDSESRLKLEKLANEQGLGPSTFARLIIGSAISAQEKLPKIVDAEKGRHDLEESQSQSIAGISLMEGDVKGNIARAKIMLNKALRNALEGDWQSAISLSEEACSIAPKDYLESIMNGVEMVWSCIQKTCVITLLDKAEGLMSEWDYAGASVELENIVKICMASKLPLDYADTSIRVANIALSCCSVAGRWKEDVDKKLERTLIGMSVIKTTLEEAIAERIEGERIYNLWR